MAVSTAAIQPQQIAKESLVGAGEACKALGRAVCSPQWLLLALQIMQTGERPCGIVHHDRTVCAIISTQLATPLPQVSPVLQVLLYKCCKSTAALIRTSDMLPGGLDRRHSWLDTRDIPRCLGCRCAPFWAGVPECTREKIAGGPWLDGGEGLAQRYW